MHKLVIAIALTLAAGIVLAASPCTTAYVKNETELWIKVGGNRALVIRDARGVNDPQWAPDGQRLLYVNDFDPAADPVSALVIVRRNGQVLSHIPITYGDGVDAALHLGWVSDNIVWLEGHATPSSSIYHEWDTRTAKELTEKWGAFFTWSPDRRVLAYREHIPHGTPSLAPSVVVNGKTVRFPQVDAANSVVTGPFAWSADSSSVVVPLLVDSKVRVAFVTRDAKLERVVETSATSRPQAVSWSDGNAVVLRNAAGRWRVSPNGEVQELGPAAAVKPAAVFCGSAAAE